MSIPLGVFLGLSGPEANTKGVIVDALMVATDTACSSLVSGHIVLAYQSVGANLLEWMHAVASAMRVELRVEEPRPSGEAKVSNFRFGVNGDPLGKTRNLRNAMSARASGRAAGPETP